jgi:hypothetical protein
MNGDGGLDADQSPNDRDKPAMRPMHDYLGYEPRGRILPRSDRDLKANDPDGALWAGKNGIQDERRNIWNQKMYEPSFDAT